MGRGYKDTPGPSHRTLVRQYIAWQKTNSEYLEEHANYINSSAFKNMDKDSQEFYLKNYQTDVEQSVEDDKRWRKQLGWDKNV